MKISMGQITTLPKDMETDFATYAKAGIRFVEMALPPLRISISRWRSKSQSGIMYQRYMTTIGSYLPTLKSILFISVRQTIFTLK